MHVYKTEISLKNFPSVKTECYNFYLSGDICLLVKECQDWGTIDYFPISYEACSMGKKNT